MSEGPLIRLCSRCDASVKACQCPPRRMPESIKAGREHAAWELGRAEGAKEERERVTTELEPLAADAQAEWANLPQFTPLAEYQRGYMNAMHQAIGILRGQHREARP